MLGFLSRPRTAFRAYALSRCSDTPAARLARESRIDAHSPVSRCCASCARILGAGRRQAAHKAYATSSRSRTVCRVQARPPLDHRATGAISPTATSEVEMQTQSFKKKFARAAALVVAAFTPIGATVDA